jgi:hypothetical protein
MMKTSTKWIIGIAAGLLLLCLAAGALTVAASWIYGSGWSLESRTGQLWSDDQSVAPWNGMPMDRSQGMWMHPYRGVDGVWFSLFSPLRIVGICLLCLGLLALIVIGIVLLVRRPGRSQAAVAPAAAPAVEPAAAPAPAPEPAAAAAASICPNCAQPVESGWSHCPHCGAPLV